tara:strand:- start:50 stop:646 length:597 start_codon:yes stop_codon:yes gene_type:complete
VNISLFIAALTFMITMYITPGPNNILCAVHGSQYGIRRTVPLISGMAFGWLVMGIFVAVTLEIIEGYKEVLSYLTYIGACYIAFLSYHIATSKPIEDANDESQMLGPRTGLILQFVNGKAWIHDLVLLGTFGSVFGSGIESKIILVFLSIILCLPAILSWTAFGTLLRRIFSTPESSVFLNRFLGVSLFLVSVWLVYY